MRLKGFIRENIFYYFTLLVIVIAVLFFIAGIIEKEKNYQKNYLRLLPELESATCEEILTENEKCMHRYASGVCSARYSALIVAKCK